jgi:type IV pilus assembly protein PilY1
MKPMKTLIALMSLTLAAGASAVELDLSRVPPSINASVPPNIMVTLDDSGSMGFGYMPDTSNFGSTDCRFYDASTNALYFNPDLAYPPPLRADGTSFPNASQNTAWRDGFSQGLGNENLVTAYRASHNHNTYQDYSSGWYTSFPSGVTNFLGQRRAFYCRNGAVRLIQDEAHNWQKFANWFSYYRTRSLAARTALSTSFARLDPSVRVARQNLNSNAITATTAISALSDTSWRTNFFSWLHAPRFSGGTPLRESLARAGRFFERSAGTTTNPYWDAQYGAELSCRQNFHLLMTDGYWTGQSGGNITTATSSIGNADVAGAAIADGKTLSGNAARLYWNATSGGVPSDNPPNMGDIAYHFWARDLRANLENDVPSYFGDSAVGVVAGATADDEIYFNPANDPANWQRMVNFIVGFGVGGTLPLTDTQLLRLRRGDEPWPRIQGGSGGSCSLGDAICRTTIDDAWHAALNSRGEYLSAQNPQELIDSLSAVLDNVSRRQGVTGSAGSTAFLRSDAIIYEASYDSGSWTGDIEAFQLNVATGEPTTVEAWGMSAGERVNGMSPSARRIFTNSGGAGGGGHRDFTWGSLTSAQQAMLNAHPLTNATDNLGPQRVAWLRGERDEEQSEGGPLRNRIGVLGPFIGSSLINVTAPRFGYRGTRDFPEGGSDYAGFRVDNRDRSPTLYIGSNDGMLHAFNAATGEERWAFVPNRVIPNLARLTIPEYQFVPFVNNTPIDHDVLIGGVWRTVLIGTLGLGGQGVYAIDVTDPDNPRFLWEFTDADDRRLGYTYGRPNVYRLADGRWVALVPAGYNSEANIDYATRGLPNQRGDSQFVAGGNNDGVVFVIDVATGESKAIPVGGARGLATVQAADYEVDFKLDFLVSGDLNGDLWRIGTENLTWSNITSATVEKLFDGVPTRPITSAPTIYPDPATGKMVVVVGTGKYLEDADREINIPRQAIYGIRECRSGCSEYPIVQGELIEQTITSGAGGYLEMGNTRVVPEASNGWFIQLGNPAIAGGALTGERVIDMSMPISFASGIVAIGSYIPSSDPCAPMGTGVIYALSALTGGYALPDGVSGANVQPGQPIFGAGGTGRSVGNLTTRPPDMSAFINPDGGNLSVMGIKINGVPVRRRSGWRELPIE